MSNINFEISPHAFPMLLKDIDLGIYLIESKIPDGSFDLNKIQVMLDSNVLSAASSDPVLFIQKISWHYGLHCVLSLNPSLAIVEQCLSNTSNNVLRNISSFESAFEPLGVFPKGYAAAMIHDVKKREAEMRQQAGFLFCFVALLRHYYLTSSSASNDLVREWIGLFSLDIPRSALMYWLGGLFILSKTNSKLKLQRQSSPIETFAQGFCSFRKEENGDYTRWLRNRVFDLLFFSLVPTLSFESLGGISSRTILASKDKFIGEFIGRVFAWYGEPKLGDSWYLAPLLRMIDTKDEESANGIQLLVQSFPEAREKPDLQVKNRRLRNLIDVTLSTLGSTEKNALHVALYEFRIFEGLGNY